MLLRRIWRHSATRIASHTLKTIHTTVANDINHKIRSDDVMLSAMTGDQDITIKIVSMTQCVEESIRCRRAECSPVAVRTMAELMMCTVLLSSNLTSKETLQINIVGNQGFNHAIAVCDDMLNTRCKISNSIFNGSGSTSDTLELFGECQIQVIRSHPSNKEPSTGIVLAQRYIINSLSDHKWLNVSRNDCSLRGDIALNLGLYVQLSEQRKAAFITEVTEFISKYCMLIAIFCFVRYLMNEIFYLIFILG